MHVLFTEEERKWMETRKFGLPIKEGCPTRIRQSIEKKKSMIASQKVIREA